MKKTFLLLLVSLLVVTAIDAKRYIAIEDIKVRDSKGKKYDTLGTIPKGTIIVTDDTVGKWRKVKDQEEVGYVNEKSLMEAPPEAVPEASLNNTVKGFINDHKLVSLGLVVVLLLVLRSISLSIQARRSEHTAVAYEEKYKSLIKYWFICKHCAASIKNDVEPSPNGCGKSLHHLWFQLAEVGQHKYHCKNCNITVNTKNDPSDHGCPSSALHRWEKKK